MKAREHKRTYYGVPIGILMLDSKFERFNGDIGNAQTWPFPVQYKIVRGAVPNKVIDTLNNRYLFQLFADAGALVSSRVATTAFPARLIASGIGLTGAWPRNRPTASSGAFS